MSTAFAKLALRSTVAAGALFALPLHAEETVDSTDDAAIVVTANAETATKTDTAIVDVPQSLSVVSADLIDARGAIGVQEALRYTPGMRTELNGSDYRFDYMILRGFQSTDFIDGMRQPDYTARVESYNLERIEVLRGPSSVLYGQAAPGGIVNSMTKLPEFDFGGEVAVQYGSFDRKQVQADVTGALNSEGTLAARFVGVYRDADNQVDFGKDDRIFLAPSLRYRSTDGATDISLSGIYQRDRAASIYSYFPVSATLLAPSEDRVIPRGTYLGEPSHNYYNADLYSGTLQATHAFSDAVTWSGRARYVHTINDNGGLDLEVWNGDVNPYQDEDDRVLARSLYDKYTRVGMFTADNNLQLNFVTGPFTHKVLVGVDYLRAKSSGWMVYAVNDQDNPDPATHVGDIDIYNPVYDPASVPSIAPEPDARSRNTQLGFYIQDQIDFASLATVVVSGRRDRATAWSEGSETDVTKATTFRAGVILHPTATLSPYISYSESFTPVTGTDFYGDTFKPQRGKQWEGGVRWQPDRNTLVSVAYFDIKGTNLLATDPDNGQNQIQVGTVTSKGFEIEASRVLPGNYTFTAAYSHVKARTGYNPDPLQVGLPISAVPADTASVWGDKRFDLGGDLSVRVGAGLRWVGHTDEGAIFYDADTDTNVLERLRTPGFVLADALVGFEWGKWTLDINATNLFDKTYFAQCSVRSACSYGYARNVMGTLGYRF
ncbi:MAG: TonB-dependent siderophore receptor [Candidatus Andeanibacterium colombiense]|uniref:TonB-dependent siderophore receptor n=1 Tax=Candidatus Andeanibacterium colombiense TaxID=3121345 RepID=A0AAJ6BNG9_9SPHN|nr:MAG: TonB-dependent siderophore receptor [Sphingomonadaceae bacterium]